MHTYTCTIHVPVIWLAALNSRAIPRHLRRHFFILRSNQALLSSVCVMQSYFALFHYVQLFQASILREQSRFSTDSSSWVRNSQTKRGNSVKPQYASLTSGVWLTHFGNCKCKALVLNNHREHSYSRWMVRFEMYTLCLRRTLRCIVKCSILSPSKYDYFFYFNPRLLYHIRIQYSAGV
jgi:hypothetical protein